MKPRIQWSPAVWNPSTDSQSVDRAYRIGQNKDIIVYRLMTCATVEEKIYRKQIFKGGLFRTATEEKEQIRYFSQQGRVFIISYRVLGVSHHSLLFSKTAPPLPEVDAEQEEVESIKRTLHAGTSTSSSALERNVNGFRKNDKIRDQRENQYAVANACKEGFSFNIT
ncbi:protein CHROMATIN REMODELING 24-like [Argentina anserina]|uniref:protein CHROMATIN REMODELING 24-like n=1 Tax=Argentina anserina TaxID=57926 RepID=UPI00217666AD|nr:protein CHROMATIN REMODELING 24-like [Potentilla anserina]